jgi:hypothetical protein
VTVNGVTATVAQDGTYTATIPAPAAGTDGPLAVTVTVDRRRTDGGYRDHTHGRHDRAR